MIATPYGIRRLLVSSCIVALLAPDIAVAAQSVLDAQKEELRVLTEQYDAAIRKMDSDRLDEGHRLTERYDRDVASKMLESSSPAHLERKRQRYFEFKVKRDALREKIAQQENSHPAPAHIAVADGTKPDTVATPESHKAEKPDKDKFVSAAEAFVNGTSSDRQAAARSAKGPSSEVNMSSGSLPRPAVASGHDEPESEMRKALSWSSKSVSSTPAVVIQIDPKAPSGKLANDGSGRMLTNSEKLMEEQDEERKSRQDREQREAYARQAQGFMDPAEAIRSFNAIKERQKSGEYVKSPAEIGQEKIDAFNKRRDEVDARINARARGKESGIDRMLRNQEAQKQEQSGSKTPDGNTVFLGAMAGLFALGMAAKAQEDREYQAMTPEQRAEYDRRRTATDRTNSSWYEDWAREKEERERAEYSRLQWNFYHGTEAPW